MKKSKSCQHRVPSKKAKHTKRVRRMESLEARTLLAADATAAWHNESLPGDVNADGKFDDMDIEILVGELRQQSVQASSSPGLLEGEQALFLDVNNDGKVSNFDLLTAMEGLMAEPEPAPSGFTVNFDMSITTDSTGSTLLAPDGGEATVNQNGTFTLNIYVQDITTPSDGGTAMDPSDDTDLSRFGQAFVDVTYDSSKVIVVDPTTDIELGSNWAPNSAGAPANVTPNGALFTVDNSFAEPGKLKWIGGTWNSGEPSDLSAPTLLASITFRTIGLTNGTPVEFKITPATNDILTGVDPGAQQVAFNQTLRNGSELTTDENLAATFLTHPNALGKDVSRFEGSQVDLVINPAPLVAGANDDNFLVNEDFGENSPNGEDTASSDPPVIIYNDQKYYVFDVLANDHDNANQPITGGDISLMSIDSISTLGAGEGTAIILDNAQSHPDIMTNMNIQSNQVILYQVPPDTSTLTGITFTYTMSYTGTEMVMGSTANVNVFIQNVEDEPTANPFTVSVEANDEDGPVSVNALDYGEVHEAGDVLTFGGFLNEDGSEPFDPTLLSGSFVEILDSNNMPTGQFTYESDMPGLVEYVRYRVTDGNGQEDIGLITLRTLANTLVNGVVYFDVDNDGVVDDNAGTTQNPELRIGGVEVQLLDTAGNPVPDPADPSVDYVVRTQADGSFRFVGIDAGDYRVRLIDPPFTRKGYTTLDGSLLTSVSEVAVTINNNGEAPGLNFGFKGRDYQYIGFGDTIASSVNDSIVLAFSKQGGEAVLEWYMVDQGWDRLVHIDQEHVLMDPVSKALQIAFQVEVDGASTPQYAVQGFSPASPGVIVIAETAQGIIIRINGTGEEVMASLAALDAAFASL